MVNRDWDVEVSGIVRDRIEKIETLLMECSSAEMIIVWVVAAGREMIGCVEFCVVRDPGVWCFTLLYQMPFGSILMKQGTMEPSDLGILFRELTIAILENGCSGC